MSSDPKTPRVNSTLSKGLAILEALAGAPGGKGVTELARDLGLTKSNAFRLLQTLSTLGYVKHQEDKTYAATLKAWQVGRRAVDNLNLRELAGPELRALGQATGETIYLAVPEGLQVVYIDKIESSKPIRSWNPIGGSAPIHCVATGKAILAIDLDRFRDRLDGNMESYTDRTLTTLTALEADLEATRWRGYAFDTGEFRERVVSFGAPILLSEEKPVAALGVSLPDINLPDGGEARLGALVQEAAASVSAKLREA